MKKPNRRRGRYLDRACQHWADAIKLIPANAKSKHRLKNSSVARSIAGKICRCGKKKGRRISKTNMRKAISIALEALETIWLVQAGMQF